MKNWIIGILVLVVLSVGGYMIFGGSGKSEEINRGQWGDITNLDNNQLATTTPTAETNKEQTVIGKSVQGNDIKAFHFGTGAEEVLLVGGVHGGYEWNTILLAEGLYDYLKANPSAIPANLKISIVFNANPDGLKKTMGGADGARTDFAAGDVPTDKALLEAGRFNANNVDLNRNFDCQWQATGVWQNTKVSGGSAPFSEPESQAIRDYVNAHHPKAVIVYYSAAGGVYSSSCGAGILPETTVLNKTYAQASGYPSYKTFNAYPTSGDMVNWLAKENIPAISVLLTNHTDIELDKNLAGVKAVLAHYAK